MIPFNVAKDGIAYYVDKNILSKYPVEGWQKIVIGSLVAISIENYVLKLQTSPAAKAIGLVSDNGIDIDPFAAEMKKRMPSTGVRVMIPMLGEAHFNVNDIDDIVETIKGRR